MNIEKAKQIPLPRIVEYLGGRFSHQGKKGETWWFSPFRPDEKTASFKIDENRNEWHDFARTAKVDAHGDTLDLWTDFHLLPRRGSDSIKRTLKDLKQFSGVIDSSLITKTQNNNSFKTKENFPRYKFIKPPGRIFNDNLKQEIGNRGLTLATVQDTLKQGHILDTVTQKSFYAFVFKNDDGGYEISVPNANGSIKRCLGKKAITTFHDGISTTALVFEGFWDFYTWKQINKGVGNNACLILNSTSMIEQGANWLIGRRNSIFSVFSFMDNDDSGSKATNDLAAMLEPHNFTFGTKNHLYKDFKDYNLWHISKPKLIP